MNGTTADVTFLEMEGRRVGRKSVEGRSLLYRRLLGRGLIQREMAIYGLLDGIPGIPRLIGPAGPYGFYFEYRPGRLFTEYTSESRMPAVFLDGLEETVRAMHARGVAHGDLGNRENILVGPDFRPTVFDFGIAARRDTSSILYNLFVDLDRRALLKYRRRHSEGDYRRVPPHPLERIARMLKRANLIHRIGKERRRRRRIKDVVHLGEERWRGRRPPGTRIRWIRPEGDERVPD